MPTTSSVDAARDAASALTHPLLNPASATPFPSIGDAQQQALTKLADILNSTFQTPLAPPRVPSTPATTPVNLRGCRLHRHPVPYYPAPPSILATATLAIPAPPKRHRLQRHQHKNRPFRARPAGQHRHRSHHRRSPRIPTPREGPPKRHLDTWLHQRTRPPCSRSWRPHETRHQKKKIIPKHEVPSNRKVTYGRIVATICPKKAETHHVRLTVGGVRLD
jgi:hypothetical protein